MRQRRRPSRKRPGGPPHEPPVWIEYVTALGPLVILTGALVAAVMAWKSTRRERWWTRTQWAADHVLSGDEDAQALGLAVLEVQVDHVHSSEEAQLIGAVTDTLYDGLIAHFIEGDDYVLDEVEKDTEDDDGR